MTVCPGQCRRLQTDHPGTPCLIICFCCAPQRQLLLRPDRQSCRTRSALRLPPATGCKLNRRKSQQTRLRQESQTWQGQPSSLASGFSTGPFLSVPGGVASLDLTKHVRHRLRHAECSRSTGHQPGVGFFGSPLSMSLEMLISVGSRCFSWAGRVHAGRPPEASLYRITTD